MKKKNTRIGHIDNTASVTTQGADSPDTTADNYPREACSFLNMESPVNQALALLRMLSNARAVETEGLGGSLNSSVAVGYSEAADNCSRELHRNWSDSHSQSLALKRGEELPAVQTGQVPAPLRLGVTVDKACALLQTLGEEVSDSENDNHAAEARRIGEIPETSGMGYLILARDCAAALLEAYKAAFREWQALWELKRKAV